MRSLPRALFVISALSLVTCSPCGKVEEPPDGGQGGGGGGDPDPVPSERCEVALDRFLASGIGTARAARIEDARDLLGGPNAQGRVGDYLLANDRIRVVIQGEARHIGPQPYGGTILDADLVRSGPGQDQFGEIGLLYNFGRTLDPRRFDILADGSEGGAAILAVTGVDAPNDYLNIRNQLKNSVGRPPVADPYVELPLKITNYFILNPGESRVRFVTAFCNEGQVDEVKLAVGDLTDPGYTVEFLNGQSCTGGFGYGGLCYGMDRMSWYGYLGSGVAYGYSPYRVEAPSRPEPENALLTVAGVTGSLIGAPGVTGLLYWFDPDLSTRPGELKVPARGSAFFARDFIVGRDLGEIATHIETTRSEITGTGTGEVSGTVTSGGRPLAGARVTFRHDLGLAAVFTTDGAGTYRGRLAVRTYSVSAWAPGRVPSPEQQVAVASGNQATTSFELVEPKRLTVSVREANGGPMPAKVTILCASGVCPSPGSTLVRYTDAIKDPLLDSIQHVGFVPASGAATFELPPGQYSVLVSRGPEYSIHPNGYPANPGVAVDLRSADGSVSAVLARVVDTTGYMSADFHVHAVNSPDSIVDNTTRVLGFAADGFDVIVSTDHDYVTDFGPYIQQAGLEPFLAHVIGEEISTMDFGHYNIFPLSRDLSDPITAGAIDWAGGRGPTLTPAELFAEARRRGARTVHFNHARGFLGGFTHLRVDTDTLATHADPSDFRMKPPEGASPLDTKLLSADFNALEVLNNGEDNFELDEVKPKLNDWFTLLSRGMKVAATGVSDTHYRSLVSGWRTFVRTGADTPQGFDPLTMSDALNGLRAIATNGPFVSIQAYRVNASGVQVTPSVGMGEVVPPSSDDLGVSVEVQVPEYLDVTRVELYTHTPNDDARCPIDPASPKAATTRVACDGALNRNWPASSVAASQAVTLTAGDLEVVTVDSGVTYRRFRATTRFRLPAPQTDNWVVAFVYGSRSLFPLVYAPPSLGKPAKPVVPFALTNPIYVDADGGGFDKPPFRPTSPLAAPKELPRPLERLPSPERFLERWGAGRGH